MLNPMVSEIVEPVHVEPVNYRFVAVKVEVNFTIPFITLSPNKFQYLFCFKDRES